MSPEVMSLLETNSIRGINLDAAGFAQDHRLLSNVSIDKFGSTSPMEAAAAKEVAKAGLPTDLAGINAGVETPKGGKA